MSKGLNLKTTAISAFLNNFRGILLEFFSKGHKKRSIYKHTLPNKVKNKIISKLTYCYKISS